MQISGMHRASLALILLVALAGRAPAAAWVDDMDALLAQQPGSGKAVVDVLERLPLADRETPDYHWLLARAHRDAGQAGPAAEAVATYALLDPRGSRDLAEVRAWLARRGDELARAAQAARQRADLLVAVRAFLVAAKCNPALLSRDENDMGAEALAVVQRAIDAHPDRVAYRFQLGFFLYLSGKLELARDAWRAYLALERDPYRAWRARTWLARAEWELAPPSPVPAGSGPLGPSMDGLERTPGGAIGR